MIVEFSIQVTNESGLPVRGAEVLVDYPWASDSGVTDDSGRVRFNKRQAFGDSALATIYINGELRAESIWVEENNELVFQVADPE